MKKILNEEELEKAQGGIVNPAKFGLVFFIIGILGTDGNTEGVHPELAGGPMMGNAHPELAGGPMMGEVYPA